MEQKPNPNKMEQDDFSDADLDKTQNNSKLSKEQEEELKEKGKQIIEQFKQMSEMHKWKDTPPEYTNRQYAPLMKNKDKDPYIDNIMKEKLSKTRDFDVKTLRIKTQYRQIYDYHSLPQGQRYIIFYTIGENENFSIQTTCEKGEIPIRGIRIFGLFDTKEHANQALSIIINEINPYAQFIRIKIVDLYYTNGYLPFPFYEDQDGAIEHPLVDKQGKILGDHLEKVYQDGKNTSDRHQNSVFTSRNNNSNIRKFNKYLEANRKFLTAIDNPTALMEKALSNFKDYVFFQNLEEKKDTQHKEKEKPKLKEFSKVKVVEHQREKKFEISDDKFKTIHPNLVLKYIKQIASKNYKQLEDDSEYKVEYVKYKRLDDKWLIVRVIDCVDSNGTIVERLGQEPLFIIDFDNTMFPDDINKGDQNNDREKFTKFEETPISEKDTTPSPKQSKVLKKQTQSPSDALKSIQKLESKMAQKNNNSDKESDIISEQVFDDQTYKNAIENAKRINQKLEQQHDDHKKDIQINEKPRAPTENNNNNNLLTTFNNALKGKDMSLQSMEQMVLAIHKQHPWFFDSASKIIQYQQFKNL